VLSWRDYLLAVIALFTIPGLITAGQRFQDEVKVNHTIPFYEDLFTVRKHVLQIYGNRMVYLEHQKQKESSADFDEHCPTPTVEIFREFRHKL
jgi:hypothetical protein